MKSILALLVTCLMAVASITSLSAAETGKAALHPRVQAALGWEIPINECGGQPRLSRAGKDIDEGDDVKRRFDVDSNTLGRHKRRQNRWIKCMTRYNQGIVDSIEMLRSSAQYGLTEPQAKIILQKMVDAQAVLTAQRPSPPQ